MDPHKSTHKNYNNKLTLFNLAVGNKTITTDNHVQNFKKVTKIENQAGSSTQSLVYDKQVTYHKLLFQCTDKIHSLKSEALTV